MPLRPMPMLKKAPLGAFFIAWLLLLGDAWALCPPAAESSLQRVTVAAVVDGDTLRLADGRRVRLVGINTPELGHNGQPTQALAQQAQQQLRAALDEAGVRLQTGKDPEDRYGRVLGHLFTAAGDNITARLLQQGAGFQVAIPPNLDYLECYRQAQDQARGRRLGVWGHPDYQPLAATDPALSGGFAHIRGEVETVELTGKAIYVELKGALSLKLEQRVARYFEPQLLDRLVAVSRAAPGATGIRVVAWGWVSDRLTWRGKTPELVRQGRRKRFQMKVTHPAMWRIDGWQRP